MRDRRAISRVRGDEPVLRRALRDDARGLRSPVYFRVTLLLDNAAAERFKRLDGHLSARVLRDAIDKTFRGALRDARGAVAIHQHGGADRPAHPHVHALLSPRFQNRMAVNISPARIQRVKERWEREVLAGLQCHERRLQLMRQLVGPSLRVLTIGTSGFHLSFCLIGQQPAWPASLSCLPVPRGPCVWSAPAPGPVVGCAAGDGGACGRGSGEGCAPGNVPPRFEGHASVYPRGPSAAA